MLLKRNQTLVSFGRRGLFLRVGADFALQGCHFGAGAGIIRVTEILHTPDEKGWGRCY